MEICIDCGLPIEKDEDKLKFFTGYAHKEPRLCNVALIAEVERLKRGIEEAEIEWCTYCKDWYIDYGEGCTTHDIELIQQYERLQP